ncbi:MAG: 2-C-methyl-D-erythritol 2,4-cyclodiphosphate synthase [Pyrinomonadaceae bacterium]
MFRIGFGTDIHRLVAGMPLILGGVRIESDLGGDGHSDADVLMHAAADAVLGSLALGDLGTHFPNEEERWRNAESSQFVNYAVGLIKEKGYSIANMDTVIDLELPKLRPHIDSMRANLAAALEVDIDQVSIKAKTGEKVDAIGERRAVRAQAIVLLYKEDAEDFLPQINADDADPKKN